uniref:Uncharacterized protein n=1 Tax=Kalanchoe fedtschenkoi TaxID=63787 RepID=A0A7N0TBH0_KALFE
MKGASRVIMGATLIMVLSLAIVLGLVLVLLAELYCSLLVRRRQLRRANAALEDAEGLSPTTESQSQGHSSSTPPLARFYSHGVLNAPRNLLFPSLHSKEEDNADSDFQQTQQSQLRQFLQSSHPGATTSAAAAAAAHQVRILSSSPPSPHHSATVAPQIQPGEDVNGSSKEHEDLVYISNPIFSSRAATPYATPDTSPSRLGNSSGSSDEDDEQANAPKHSSPPLSPMKELPAEGCSVSLKDARCLGTSGSDSHSINGGGGSTSSSGTPCTSPSW